MIRGYFYRMDATSRPFSSARFQFPTLNNRLLGVELLVDTGADLTILSPQDAQRVGIDITTLPVGSPGIGVGGQAPTRVVEAVLTIGNFSTLLNLPIPVTPNPIPSLPGREILGHFALFMEERTQRVLLLEPHEADALQL